MISAHPRAAGLSPLGRWPWQKRGCYTPLKGNWSPLLQMRLSTAALAARRVFAATSHSAHEGGGQCVFTATFQQTQALSRKQTHRCVSGLLLNINCRAAQPKPSFLRGPCSRRPLPLSLLFFHSEDLEDTDFCLGHPRRHHLHGQHLREGARAPARAARIRAASAPAHPHQGEPRTDHTVRDGTFSWSLSAPVCL